jgi:hypothetical protein
MSNSTNGGSDKFNYRSKKKYEISISFNNKYQFVQSNPVMKEEVKDLMFGLETPNDSITRLTQFCDFIKDEYIRYFERSKYKLYLELSDPKYIEKCDKRWKYPRLHLHGVIEWDSPMDLLHWKLNIMPHITNYGNIQLNPYRVNHWDKYIKKDYKWWKKILKEIKSNNDELTNMKFYKNLQCCWNNTVSQSDDLFS